MDSGIGGLSILQAFLDAEIQADYHYLADALFLPYGTQPIAQLHKRTLSIAEFMVEQLNVDAFIIACNTATASSAELIRKYYPKQIVIGIEPAIKPASLHTKSGHIAVAATDSTLMSQRLNHLIATYSNRIHVHKISGSRWVSLVERGDLTSEYAKNILMEDLKPYLKYPIDQFILGCTHFPFLSELLSEILPQSTILINPAEALVKQTIKRLKDANLYTQHTPTTLIAPHHIPRKLHFYTTGALTPYKKQLMQLKFPIHSIEPLSL